MEGIEKRLGRALTQADCAGDNFEWDELVWSYDSS
jgi:hypothetical protein